MTVQRVERDRQQAAEQTETAPEQRWAVGPSSSLQRFAADARAGYTTAVSIAKTPFVPTSYKQRGTKNNRTWLAPEEVAANVTAAWLAGEEIGLRPMQALSAIDIIEGRPALNAQAMRALLQSRGHDVWVEDQPVPGTAMTALAVTVCGLRQGQPESRVQRVTWTWQRARQAGLVSKTNWENHPIEMLIARATSAVCRLIASDVLMGLAYSAEELQDELGAFEDTPTGTVSRRKSTGVGRGSVQERQLSPVPESPPAASEPSPEEEQQPEQPTQGEDEEAQEERTGAAWEAEPQEGLCNNPHGDGRLCTREAEHGGKHYYGQKKQPAAAPQQREPSPPAPEALHGESSPQAVGDYEPSAEEREEANEGPEEEGQGELYPEPSQAELDAAWEEEQARQRARDAEAQAEAERARQGADVPEPGDDPWADFR